MAVDEMADGLVLLVGSGRQFDREYLLQGASRRSPLWLIDDRAATWQRPYLRGSGVVPPLDRTRLIPDQPGLLAAAAELARDRPVRGVLTYEELLVSTTAHIADSLGLPGLTAGAAECCRNKHKTRLALTAAGLPQPGYALARTAAGAREAAAGIGLPVVLKPRGMGASAGVVRVDSPQELAAAFGVAERASQRGPVAYAGGVLVEEFVDGPEISVDGAIIDGRYTPFWVAHKHLGLAPYFEEVGHTVDAADPLLTDARLLRVLQRAHTALGVRYGITHTEVRLAAQGPVVIEVNARLGGDLIPYLGMLATGVDPGRVAVEVALGVPPTPPAGRTGCAGVRFLYPPQDCEVLGVTVPEPAAVPGLVAARAMVPPGTRLRLPPRAHVGRYAYLVCTADDAATCTARLAAAAARVELDYQPLGESEVAGCRPW
jgi:hypothetical protein